MVFRTTITPELSPWKITHQNKVFSIGSCFSNHIHQRLKYFGFEVMNNPFGVLFQPLAIENCINRCIYNIAYQPDELSEHKGIYFSWDHSTIFDNSSAQQALSNINNHLELANEYLQRADTFIVTLGTAWVYELRGLDVAVANCHKVPGEMFEKRLLEIHEIKSALHSIYGKITDLNSNARVLLTISPVRHWRDGYQQNQRSKARLIEAVFDFCQKHDASYFPAYEILMDDLRDYRFYADDLLHPSAQAVDYIWEKFVGSFMEDDTVALCETVDKLRRSLNHKPLNPNSTEHKKFLYNTNKLKKEIEAILKRSLDNE